MMSREIILGTRGSKLALYQSNLVLNKLQTQYPNHNFKLKKILTKGDKFLEEPLETSIEKGFFVKEIQENHFYVKTFYGITKKFLLVQLYLRLKQQIVFMEIWFHQYLFITNIVKILYKES